MTRVFAGRRRNVLSEAPSRRVTYKGLSPEERIAAAGRVPRHDQYMRSLPPEDSESRRCEGETASSI
jgi:hypothetical protein